MTNRGEQQRIGDAGEAVVLAMLQRRGDWIGRPQHTDIGVDLEAELDDPEALGHFLKLQVKTTTDEPPDDGITTVSLSKTFVRYAMECRLPVVVVRLWLPSERASYVWVQEWIAENRAALTFDVGTPESVSVRVDRSFGDDLAGRLKLIARGATTLQFRLGLRDVARWAVLHRNVAAVRQLSELLVALGHQSDAPVATMIDELIAFSSVGMGPGQMRAVWEYHPELIPLMLAICRAFATQFTAADVARMVVRGDSISRAALYGLGALYDTAPEHMLSLRLPEAFDQGGQFWLAFYCRLRERYPGVRSIDLAMGSLPLEAPGGRVDRRDGFHNAYANRGEAALYDYFEPSDDMRAKLIAQIPPDVIEQLPREVLEKLPPELRARLRPPVSTE